MPLSEEEKHKYLASITPDIEAALDQGFKALFGYTYRDNDVPSKHVALPHGAQNGDGSKHPPDSWQQIRRDHPDVFGP
jgi:hypothetical protein